MLEEKSIPIPTCESINDEPARKFLKWHMKSTAKKYNTRLKYTTSGDLKNTSQLNKIKRSNVITLGKFDDIKHELISFFYELAKTLKTNILVNFMESMVSSDNTPMLLEIHTDNINKGLMLARDEFNIEFSSDDIHWLLNRLMPCTCQAKESPTPVSSEYLGKNVFDQNELDKDIHQALKSKLLEFINCVPIRNLIINDSQAAQLYNNTMYLYVNKKYPAALVLAINCMRVLTNYDFGKVCKGFCKLQSELECLHLDINDKQKRELSSF